MCKLTFEQRIFSEALFSHIQVIDSLKTQNDFVLKIADLLFRCILDRQRVFLCGNGGSAADAQHIAAELVGRFRKERRGLPAIALTTDTSILTAVGNDYGYEQVFARQVEALALAGDVLIGISTSGNSPNVVEAVKAAKRLGVQTIGLTGGTGGALRSLCDEVLVVPSDVTARIQEAHILIGHIWCELIDELLNADESAAA